MKFVVAAIVLIGLLSTAADARSAACRAGNSTQIDCRKTSTLEMKAPRKARALEERGITPADRENLERARASSSLRNIEVQRIGR